MKRRNFIHGFSALSLATTLSPGSIAETSSKKKKSLKIAFLSDTHVKPTETAETIQ
jgi:predicted MPP superfamily phosphohydrolase